MRFCMPLKKHLLMLAVIVTATYAWTPTTYAQDDAKESVAAEIQAESFDFQGEYTGDLEVEERKIRVGMQVIALGDSNFKLAVYHGGLPGDGWVADSGYDVVENPEWNGTVVTFSKDNRRVEFSAGAGQVYVVDNHIGQLDRVIRESETLGAKPPEGAVVLFDGTSGEQFEAQDGGDPVVEGVLRQGIISKRKFNGDFSLHIEFQLPFEPTKSGQARGNSGIYVQGRYEVQMLDSFGLDGMDNECGGIYEIKKPDVNMCYPPGSWQTYDIDFQSAKWDGDEKSAHARMSVRHNGVVIHDDVEVPRATRAAPSPESAEPGFLYLQDHGSPVRYRNIWVHQK